MRKILLLILPLLLCVFSINAQTISSEDNAATSLVSANKTLVGLTDENLKNLILSSTYLDNTTGIRMVYMIQTYKSLPVWNQMLVFASTLIFQ